MAFLQFVLLPAQPVERLGGKAGLREQRGTMRDVRRPHDVRVTCPFGAEADPPPHR